MRTVPILIVAVAMTLAARDNARAQSFTSLRFSNATKADRGRTEAHSQNWMYIFAVGIIAWSRASDFWPLRVASPAAAICRWGCLLSWQIAEPAYSFVGS